MEAVILIGLQASGKSSFCRERFFATHLRLNLDMLRTRHRERLLLGVCAETRLRFVVDNTNPSRVERKVYIEAARAAGMRVVGYVFPPDVEACLRRNAVRADGERVPPAAVRQTAGRWEEPGSEEGFDELFRVVLADGGFTVRGWGDDV